MDDFTDRIDAALARVLHSTYVNTDLACHFILAEIHAAAIGA